MEHPTPGPIPVPPYFPVVWQKPEDPQLFWRFDRMHFPDALPPLAFAATPLYGLSYAFEHYGVPMRMYTRHLNYYYYETYAPEMLSPKEMEAAGKRVQENIGAAMARLGEYWETEILAEVKQHVAYLESYDLASANMPQLLAHFDDTLARAERLWQLHFLIALPFLIAMGVFDEFYADIFGKNNSFSTYQLLQGLDNKTVETDLELWKLSRKALAQPVVREILETEATTDVIPALQQSPEGRAFLDDLHAYLNEYGQRGEMFNTVAVPSWIEDPTPMIKNLKDFVGQPERDMEQERAAQVVEREQALAEVRERLKGYPQPVVAQFEHLLKAAQEATILSEDHGFWIDYKGMYQVRRVIMELGRRFADAGVIAEPSDILFLAPEEVHETGERLPELGRKSLIAKRQAEFEHFKTIQPPPVLGTLPPGPPPDDVVGRTITKFFGGPPPQSDEPNVVKGNPGSPGVARGIARVVRSLSEADRLRQGEILVAETTAPPWTPLFATAAAVVTDTGGILSHCAVVAREYRIPAVVGTGIATAVIKDGQQIEVDGTTGVIRIL